MSASLAQRYHRVLHDLDALTHELERRVLDRTDELARRGEELAQAYQRMEELAMRDGLTGLLNRRAIEQRALAHLAEAERRGLPFALALVDVDHFKALNDAHGHAAGDAGLGHVGRCLSLALREYDAVGRWGGEEFLVLLPGADLSTAAAAAERLREAVELTPLAAGGGASLHLTVSVGVAALTAEASSLDDLLKAADGALYRAKAAGRNRVLVG
jgi:diguanylate cyclase (GGDEF)-like protein